MQVTVTFKNFDPSDALKYYATKKLDRISKMLDMPSEAAVVFSVEKRRHIVEINLVSGRTTVHVKEESEAMNAAIDIAVDKIRRQVDRSKKRMIDRKNGHSGIGDAMADEINETPVETDDLEMEDDFDDQMQKLA